MSDTTRDDFDDEDRLPWLEAVEEEERGPSPLKMILAIILGLALIAAVVYGLYWLGNRNAPAGGEEIIASPGDYKMRPNDPGGMRVDNSIGTQAQTAQGADLNASINRGAQPEAPVQRPDQAQNGQQAQNAQPAQPQRPATPAPAPAQPQAQPQRPQPAPARPAGPTIQVGAFPSEAIANSEWQQLIRRYPYARGLQPSVTVFQNAGRTYYRLRASGPDATAICTRLRAAGQPCFVPN